MFTRIQLICNHKSTNLCLKTDFISENVSKLNKYLPLTDGRKLKTLILVLHNTTGNAATMAVPGTVAGTLYSVKLIS